MPTVRGVTKQWTERCAAVGERIIISSGFYQVGLDQSLQKVYVPTGFVTGEKLWIPHGSSAHVLDVPPDGSSSIAVGDDLVAVYTVGKEQFGSVPPIGWSRSTHFAKNGELVNFSDLDNVVIRLGKKVAFRKRIWLFIKPW